VPARATKHAYVVGRGATALHAYSLEELKKSNISYGIRKWNLPKAYWSYQNLNANTKTIEFSVLPKGPILLSIAPCNLKSLQ
jgi:hypothetical protein